MKFSSHTSMQNEGYNTSVQISRNESLIFSHLTANLNSRTKLSFVCFVVLLCFYTVNSKRHNFYKCVEYPKLLFHLIAAMLWTSYWELFTTIGCLLHPYAVFVWKDFCWMQWHFIQLGFWHIYVMLLGWYVSNAIRSNNSFNVFNINLCIPIGSWRTNVGHMYYNFGRMSNANYIKTPEILSMTRMIRIY